MQPLPHRIGGCELLELAHHLRMVPGGQIGFHARLDGGEPLFLQARDLCAGERGGGDIDQRRPAPERERLAEDLRRLRGIAALHPLVTLGDQPLEAVGVELTLTDM